MPECHQSSPVDPQPTDRPIAGQTVPRISDCVLDLLPRGASAILVVVPIAVQVRFNVAPLVAFVSVTRVEAESICRPVVVEVTSRFKVRPLLVMVAPVPVLLTSNRFVYAYSPWCVSVRWASADASVPSVSDELVRQAHPEMPASARPVGYLLRSVREKCK